MSVSVEATAAWCRQLLEKSPDFPSLERCLQKIPTLDALGDLPAGTRVLVRGDTDVVFDDAETFQRVKATGVLCPALFARLYNVPEEHVLFTPYDAAFAFKATFPRLVP